MLRAIRTKLTYYVFCTISYILRKFGWDRMTIWYSFHRNNRIQLIFSMKSFVVFLAISTKPHRLNLSRPNDFCLAGPVAGKTLKQRKADIYVKKFNNHVKLGCSLWSVRFGYSCEKINHLHLTFPPEISASVASRGWRAKPVGGVGPYCIIHIGSRLTLFACLWALTSAFISTGYFTVGPSRLNAMFHT